MNARARRFARRAAERRDRRRVKSDRHRTLRPLELRTYPIPKPRKDTDE